MTEYREVAQAAYEAFHLALKDNFPWWLDVPEKDKDAWRAAARAAIQEGWRK